jgi:Flp pilus assembly protein TadG
VWGRRRDDEGAIAVLAGVMIPVVLVVVALAFATLVWGASETEVQRASDEAAEQAAATAVLVDFPYASVTTLANASYPQLSSQVVSQLLSSLPSLSACSTIGNPVSAVSGLLGSGGLLGSILSGLGIGSTSTLTTALASLPAPLGTALASLPANCAGLGSIAPFPNLPVPTSKTLCDQAAAGVTSSTAPYSNRFFDGASSDAQPTCANGRVRVAFGTGSPLLGFGGAGVTVGDNLQLSLASGISTVQTSLASLGVHLDTSLTSLICPQVNVEIDQPVRSPVLPKTSVVNGRASAKRVVKNAVVVPVFNGLSLQSVTGANAAALAPGGMGTLVNGATTIPAVNLNSTLLAGQKALLGVLDTLNASINAKLTADNLGVVQLNGTLTNVTAGPSLPAPLPAVAGNVGSLNLLSCLRNTLAQIYDPPVGDAPTVDEVLKNAAATGDTVMAVQVGVQSCAGAVSAAAALSCVTAAVPAGAASVLNKLTGLYDIPFLDVTPVMVKDIGNGNFAAVPVHATQANGAFRAALVRSTDERYAP